MNRFLVSLLIALFGISVMSDNHSEAVANANMPHYHVLVDMPTTEGWILDCLERANKLVTKYIGKYLARTATHECVEGHSESAALRNIIFWPSKTATLGFMNDPEYALHLKTWTLGLISYHFLIEAKDDFATK